MLPQNFDIDRGFTTFGKISTILGSSIISEILSSPFERAKIKMQTKSSSASPGLFHLKDLSSILNEIKAKEGFKEIFYGLKGLLDRAVVFNMTRFYGYYLCMNYISMNPTHEFRDVDVFASTLISTSLATIFSQPSEVLRLKMQGERIGDELNKKVNMSGKVQQIITAYGSHHALTTGLGWNLMTQNIQALIEVFSFFAVRKFLTKDRQYEASYATNIASAFIASGIGALVTTPLDFFYTRFAFRALSKRPTTYSSYLIVTTKNEGLGGLYKTFLPHFYKNVVFNMSMAAILQFVCTSNNAETNFGENPTKGQNVEQINFTEEHKEKLE